MSAQQIQYTGSGFDGNFVHDPATGYTGIGTSNPAFPLDISSNSFSALRINGTAGNTGSNNTQIRFAGGKSGELWAIGTDVDAGSGSKDFHFYALPNAGNATAMTLQATTGNVGIGTSSPVSLLNLYTSGISANTDVLTLQAGSYSATNVEQRIKFNDFRGYNLGYMGVGFDPTDGVGGYVAFGTSSSGPGIAPTERMRISALGNIGIGTTTPAHTLDVAGDGNFSGNLATGGTFNGAVNGGIRGDATNTVIQVPANGYLYLCGQ